MLISFFTACQVDKPSNEHIKFKWLDNNVVLKSDRNITNKYKMTNSLYESMGVFSFSVQANDSTIIGIDTTSLLDGSFTEISRVTYNLKTNQSSKYVSKIKTKNSLTSVNLNANNKQINFDYHVKDSLGNELFSTRIDSIFNYKIIRNEVYMFLNSLSVDSKDTLTFNMLLPDNLQTVKSSINYESEEKITVPAGKFNTSVFYLKAGGPLDNRIWINKKPPHQMIKFSVVNQGINIELIESIIKN